MPMLGAVTAISAVIPSQVIGAIAIDAIDAFGVQKREIGRNRPAAGRLAAKGVSLSCL